MTAKVWTHSLDVVGLGFRVKRPTRVELAALIEKRGGIRNMQLVREPDNLVDTNAIMVCLPKRLWTGMQIGYLRSPTAELLAPRLDIGTLRVKSAVLALLSQDNDFKEGTLDVTFSEVPKSS